MANDAVTTNETIVKCGVKSVQVFNNGDGTLRYRMNLDVAIDARKKNYETEEYETVQLDYIDFVPRVLIAQCINLVEGLDIMYTKKKETALKNDNSAGFGAAELQIVLRNAKFEIKRTKFVAGDEYTTANGEVGTHEHEGYNTDIISIKVSDRVQVNLDKLMDSIFEM